MLIQIVMKVIPDYISLHPGYASLPVPESQVQWRATIAEIERVTASPLGRGSPEVSAALVKIYFPR